MGSFQPLVTQMKLASTSTLPHLSAFYTWCLYSTSLEGTVDNILSFKTTGLLIPLGKTILNGSLLYLHILRGLPTMQDLYCSSPWPFLKLLCGIGNNLRDEAMSPSGTKSRLTYCLL